MFWLGVFTGYLIGFMLSVVYYTAVTQWREAEAFRDPADRGR